MGIRLVAGRGAGKSRFLGRTLSWRDFARGIPTVIIDPIGGVADNFIDVITRQPRAVQEKLWPRVRYVDMGGAYGRVIPLPLYFAFGGETLFARAQRFLEVIRRSDPALQGASILGFNALAHIGSFVGMVLAATQMQISEAEDLLANPLAWEGRIHAAGQRHADLAPAASYLLREYPALSEREREQQTMTFRRKAAMFRLDPTLASQYAADTAGINWDEVMKSRLCVIFDYRHVLDYERKRFGIVWVFAYLMEFIKRRGPGRHRPLSLVIDELTFLLGEADATFLPIVDDLEELIGRLARNHSIWLTLCHQELNQLNERVADLLMTLGTQIFGVTSEIAAAETVATRFYRFDPNMVKKTEPIYASYQGMSEVIDHRSVEFTRDEQTYLDALQLLDLPKFTFLAAIAQDEGSLPTSLQRLSIASIDAGQYVDAERVERARRALVERDGRRVEDVLAEIARRQGGEAARGTHAARHSQQHRTRRSQSLA